MATVKAINPTAEIVEVKGLYTPENFEATYRDQVGRCTHLVFFADTDDSIGRGVYREILYALESGLEVSFLNAEEWNLELIDNGRSWKKYARVIWSDHVR